MVFSFTEEHEAMRTMVARFLDQTSPMEETRSLMQTDGGFTRDQWQEMADQTGVQGLHVPEGYGGLGFGFIELGIVLEEMGRRLVCTPYFSTVCLAANALLSLDDGPIKKDLLSRIASGRTTATLAFSEQEAPWEPGGIQTSYGRDGADFVLSGDKTFVVDGHTADVVLVAARQVGTTGEEGLSLFAVDGDADGLTRTALETMDLTRKQARLDLDGVRGDLIGEEGRAAVPLARTLLQAAVCLALEQVGGAQRTLDMAVEYAKVREQFGRPIGSFQAIKHRCADMLLQVEAARSTAYYAAWSVTGAPDQLDESAAMAKARCSDAYTFCAAENLQIHGGLGFTWEHDAHLFLRRAKASEHYLGDATMHREHLAHLIGV